MKGTHRGAAGQVAIVALLVCAACKASKPEMTPEECETGGDDECSEVPDGSDGSAVTDAGVEELDASLDASDSSGCRGIAPTYVDAQPTVCNDGGVTTYTNNPFTTREECDQAYASMPPVVYVPPTDRFANLERTLATLCCSGTLNVVMLGDSIINNTSHSRWEEYLSEATGATIQKKTSIRGATGPVWYQDDSRVFCSALKFTPDLLVLGGISEIDIKAIRSMVTQVQSISNTEILLMSPVFGPTDPSDPSQWSFDIKDGSVRAQMKQLAQEMHFSFFDLTAYWGKYVLDSGRELQSFKVDQIHGNQQGEQILGRLLTAHLNPHAGDEACPP